MAFAALKSNQNDHTLIDAITYLASLVSDPKVISSWLDTLRLITARMQPNQPLPGQDRAQLVEVFDRLTDHLLHHDTMRSFTEADLERQLMDKLGLSDQGPRRHESALKALATLVATGVSFPVGAGLAAVLGLPHPLLFGSVFATTTLHAGLVWLYWSSLSTFTPALQQAYHWICYSMIGLCVAAATSPLMSAFPQWGDIPLLSYGGIVVYVAAPAFMLMFHGMRLLAKSLSIKTRLTSWPLSIALTLGGWLLLAVLPHSPVPDESIFDFVQITYVVIAVYNALAAILGFTIMRQVASRYAQAVGWLAGACAQLTIMCLCVVVMNFLTGPMHAGPKLTIIGAVFGSSLIPMLVSGYKFSRSVGKS